MVCVLWPAPAAAAATFPRGIAAAHSKYAAKITKRRSIFNPSLQCRRCASAAVRLWRSLRFLFRSAARCNISSCCCRRHLRRSSAALFSFCWFKRRAPFLICLRRQSRCRLWRAAVFRSSAAAFARRCAARCWFLSAACTASAASRCSCLRPAFRARRHPNNPANNLRFRS